MNALVEMKCGCGRMFVASDARAFPKCGRCVAALAGAKLAPAQLAPKRERTWLVWLAVFVWAVVAAFTVAATWL